MIMDEIFKEEEINVATKARRRIFAYLVDLLINISAALILFIPTIIALINSVSSIRGIDLFALVIASILSGALMLCFYAFYFIFLPSLLNGQTIGKRLNKIRIIDITTSESPNLKTMFIREGSRILVYLFTFGLAAIASMIALCLNNKRMAFHEQISMTRVVNVNIFSLNNDE